MEAPTIPNIPAAPAAPTTSAAPAAPQQTQTVAPAAPQQTTMQAQTGYNNQQNNPQNSPLEIIGRVSVPSKQLFEATGFIDHSKQFPTSNAFLMFVPSVPDQTKTTGRTYDQNQKETMKVNIRDLFALAEALDYAGKYKQCDFMIFTDSSKFAGTQGQGVTKKVTVSAAPSQRDPNKYMVFLSYQGTKKVTLAMDTWMAIGIAGQLRNLAQAVENERFKKERG